jgi:hypothetical protein
MSGLAFARMLLSEDPRGASAPPVSRRLAMNRSRAAMLACFATLGVVSPASAQRVLPVDPAVVVPPVSERQLRDAERDVERVTGPRRNDTRPETMSSPASDNPGLDYDVTSELQQRQLERRRN